MNLAFSILHPLVITLGLELSAAVLLKVRKGKELLVIVLVNLITNPLLNVTLLVLAERLPYYAYRWWIPVMEVIIWLAEGLAFRKFLKSVKQPFLFSLCLNGISYFIGGWLGRMIISLLY